MENNFKKIVNKDWIKNLNEIFARFGIVPKNYHNFVEAMTHSSYSHENNLDYNYERYEFIGDAAISWIISNFLFSSKELNEGEMSIKKAKLISGKILTEAAKKIGLEKLVIFGKGLEKISDKILENIFESFVGVIAKQLGIKKAATIIDYCIIDPYLKGLIDVDKPYKTLIQEALMRSSSNEIKYIPIECNDSEDKKVKLVFDGNVYGIGIAKTIKLAEEKAAKEAYSKLKHKNNC